MKLTRSYWFVGLFLAMVAAPAVAQFEVSPDHFGDDVQKPGSSRPAVSLQQQIGAQRALLATYRSQIKNKAALVRKAQRDLKRSAPGADDSDLKNTLVRQQRELERLRRSLLDGEAALTRLEEWHETSLAGKAPERAAETLSASK